MADTGKFEEGNKSNLDLPNPIGETLEPNNNVEWDGSESNKRRKLEISTENEENITDAENTAVVDQTDENDNNDNHAMVVDQTDENDNNDNHAMVVDQAEENDNNDNHVMAEAGIDEGNAILIEEGYDSDLYDDYSDDDDSDSDYYYSTDDSSYDSSNCSFFSDEPCRADSDSSELSDDSDSEDMNFY